MDLSVAREVHADELVAFLAPHSLLLVSMTYGHQSVMCVSFGLVL